MQQRAEVLYGCWMIGKQMDSREARQQCDEAASPNRVQMLKQCWQKANSKWRVKLEVSCGCWTICKQTGLREGGQKCDGTKEGSQMSCKLPPVTIGQLNSSSCQSSVISHQLKLPNMEHGTAGRLWWLMTDDWQLNELSQPNAKNAWTMLTTGNKQQRHWSKCIPKRKTQNTSKQKPMEVEKYHKA